jgi:RHS repeat-associated protein
MFTAAVILRDSLPRRREADSVGFVILLAEHDEPSLAAQKKQRAASSKRATSTPQNRVRDFFNSPLGRPVPAPQLSWENATGSVQCSYETASGQGYYYTRDHLGSVREMLNGSGTIVARYAYDPYGRPTLVQGANLATFQYAQMYFHQPSGLDLPPKRGGYDSNLGRFIQRDHIGERGGINLYEYASDCSINLNDPLGLAAGTFDVNFNPPTGGPGEEPTPNGFNQAVQITYHKDPKECCKNIRFVQTFIQYTSATPLGHSPKIDNLGGPDPFYPFQSTTPGGAQMDDEPGPDDFGSRLNATWFGYKIVFKTCAVCADKGPEHNKILGCVSWSVYKPPLGAANQTTGGGTGQPAGEP